jgi:hypothetical protein
MDDEEVPPYGGPKNPMDHQVTESNKKKSNKIISEEISRMQQLAGIKKVM